MNIPQQRYLHPSTHLFTLRLWVEGFGESRGEVRMQVKHVLSGETCYFRDWSAVVAYLITKLQEFDQPSNEENDEDSLPC